MSCGKGAATSCWPNATKAARRSNRKAVQSECRAKVLSDCAFSCNGANVHQPKNTFSQLRAYAYHMESSCLLTLPKQNSAAATCQATSRTPNQATRVQAPSTNPTQAKRGFKGFHACQHCCQAFRMCVCVRMRVRVCVRVRVRVRARVRARVRMRRR